MSEDVPNERIFNPEQYFIGPGRTGGLEQPSDIFHHILHRDKAIGLWKLVFNNLKAKRKVDRTLIIDTTAIVVVVDGALHTQPIQPSPIARNGNNGVKKPSATGNKFLPKVDADGKILDASTTASYGVYFGAGSVHNQSGLLPVEGKLNLSGTVPTKETAILVGCTTLLKYVLTNLSPSPSSTASWITSPPFVLPSVSVLNTSSPQPSTPIPKSTPAVRPLQQIVILTSSPYLTKCMSSYVHVWEKNGYIDSRGMFVENARELRDLENVVGKCEGKGIGVRFWCVEGGEKGIGGLWEAKMLAESILEDEMSEEMVEGKEEGMKEGTREAGTVDAGIKREANLANLANWDGNGNAIRILPTRKVDEREEVGDYSGILVRTDDMYDMEALELELEKGFVSF